MNFFLSAKHWQIFLILLLGSFLINFTIEYDLTLTLLLRAIGMLIYYSWYLFIGHGLFGYLHRKVELNYNLFIINFFVWMAAYIAIIIYSDGSGMIFTGFAAIPMFYVLYAVIYVFLFPARVLKSVEIRNKASFSEYIGYVLMMIFWPIGVWILQPQINKIVEAEPSEEN